MERDEKCWACEGTGHPWCRKCNGTGMQDFNPWEMPVNISSTCNRCSGTGRDPDPDPECRGTGLRLAPVGK